MAVNKIYLDTSAYTHFKAGDSQTVRIISEAKLVGIPAIVLGELRAGFRVGRRYQYNESELRVFLSNPVVQVFDIDDNASYHYAEIYFDLRRKGTPIPTNDMWVAAIAAREGATVVTFDAHFDLIDKVGKCRLP